MYVNREINECYCKYMITIMKIKSTFLYTTWAMFTLFIILFYLISYSELFVS